MYYSVAFYDKPKTAGSAVIQIYRKDALLMKKIFALGFFDGVHLGHQALLARCCELAQEADATACAITFQQHPQTLFLEQPPRLISTVRDRLWLLRKYGIGPVRVYPVTKEIMSMSWQGFLEELLSCGAVGFVCGSDFRFGCRGEGTAEKLTQFCKERQLPCAVVEQQLLDGVRISSTHIRKLLEAGDLTRAQSFLGHPHTLTGTVISGRKLGRTIGIPTANLPLPEEIVALPRGVYACKAFTGEGEFLAVTNIGARPTVGGHHVTVESWLLDFAGDLYGKELTLEFHSFLRPEQTFPSLALLGEEIRKNAEQTRKFFENC